MNRCIKFCGRMFNFHLYATLLLVLACTKETVQVKHINGEIAVRDIDLASRLSARIKTVHVFEGQKVRAGDLLITFDDDVMVARKSRAEADLNAAKTQKAIADDAVRPEELRQLEALVSASRKQAEFAANTLNRTKALFEQGAIAKQQLEEVEFAAHSARAKLDADQAKWEMAKIGARIEQKEAAAALVAKAATGLTEVNAFDKDLTLTAPFDGEVFQLLGDEGELIPQGMAVVTLLDTRQIWGTFSLAEDKLKHVTMGKQLSLMIPALNQDVWGTVSYIAPMASFATKTYTEDRSSFDIKTFEVRVTLSEVPSSLRPGMSCVLNLTEGLSASHPKDAP